MNDTELTKTDPPKPATETPTEPDTKPTGPTGVCVCITGGVQLGRVTPMERILTEPGRLAKMIGACSDAIGKPVHLCVWNLAYHKLGLLEPDTWKSYWPIKGLGDRYMWVGGMPTMETSLALREWSDDVPKPNAMERFGGLSLWNIDQIIELARLGQFEGVKVVIDYLEKQCVDDGFMPDDAPQFDDRMDESIQHRTRLYANLLARVARERFIRGEWSNTNPVDEDVQPWIMSHHQHLDDNPANAAAWAERNCDHHRGVVAFARTPFDVQQEMFVAAATAGASTMFTSNEPFVRFARNDVSGMVESVKTMNGLSEAMEGTR